MSDICPIFVRYRVKFNETHYCPLLVNSSHSTLLTIYISVIYRKYIKAVKCYIPLYFIAISRIPTESRHQQTRTAHAVRVLYSSQGVESELSKALAAIQNRHSAQQNGGLLRDDDGPRRQGCASKASKSHSRAGSKQSKASKSHFRACSKSQPLSDICPI